MKKFILLFIIPLLATTLIAQDEYEDEVPYDGEEEFKPLKKERKDFVHNFLVGGSGGFSVGNNTLVFDLNPVVAYQIVRDRLEVGVGVAYTFGRWQEITGIEHKTNIIGPQVYFRGYVWEGLFAQFDGIYSVYKDKTKTTPVNKFKTTYGNVFAGGGFRSGGEKVYYDVGIKVNLLEVENSPYAKRWPIPYFGVFVRL